MNKLTLPIGLLVACALLAVPVGAMFMPVAAALVIAGFLSIIVGGREVSGRLLGAGFMLAIACTFWDGVAAQTRAFIGAFFNDPTAVIVLIVMIVAGVVLVLAKTISMERRKSKPPTPRARARASLLEPHEPPSRGPTSSQGNDDLNLFGDRRG